MAARLLLSASSARHEESAALVVVPCGEEPEPLQQLLGAGDSDGVGCRSRGLGAAARAVRPRDGLNSADLAGCAPLGAPLGASLGEPLGAPLGEPLGAPLGAAAADEDESCVCASGGGAQARAGRTGAGAAMTSATEYAATAPSGAAVASSAVVMPLRSPTATHSSREIAARHSKSPDAMACAALGDVTSDDSEGSESTSFRPRRTPCRRATALISELSKCSATTFCALVREAARSILHRTTPSLRSSRLSRSRHSRSGTMLISYTAASERSLFIATSAMRAPVEPHPSVARLSTPQQDETVGSPGTARSRILRE